MTLKNLLFTAKGVIKLVDYGFLKQMFADLSELRITDEPVGSDRDVGFTISDKDSKPIW